MGAAPPAPGRPLRSGAPRHAGESASLAADCHPPPAPIHFMAAQGAPSPLSRAERLKPRPFQLRCPGPTLSSCDGPGPAFEGGVPRAGRREPRPPDQSEASPGNRATPLPTWLRPDFGQEVVAEPCCGIVWSAEQEDPQAAKWGPAVPRSQARRCRGEGCWGARWERARGRRLSALRFVRRSSFADFLHLSLSVSPPFCLRSNPPTSRLSFLFSTALLLFFAPFLLPLPL